MRTRPSVVAFDVNETLLDLAPVAGALVEHGLPGSLLPAVFSRSLSIGFALAVAGSWCSFRQAFDTALAQATDLDPAARNSVAGAFGELSPHPDVEPALRLLAEAGVRAVTLTQGTAGVAEAGLTRGGVAPLVERSLTTESVQVWKPSRAAYLWAAGTCGVAPADLALVAVHAWDVHGAQRAGLTGAWCARAEGRLGDAFDPPHVQGADLVATVRELLALPVPG